MMLRQIFMAYQRTTHSMKQKRCAIRGQVFNLVGRKHILGCDSYCGTCVDSNSRAERLANLNLSHAGTENVCLDLIKSSHESSKILVQAANLVIF